MLMPVVAVNVLVIKKSRLFMVTCFLIRF
jgi:hypothetical protein